MQGREREEGREGEISCLLVHFSDGSDIQAGPARILESGHQSWPSIQVARARILKPSTAAFLNKYLNKCCNQECCWDLKHRHCDTRCRCFKWCLTQPLDQMPTLRLKKNYYDAYNNQWYRFVLRCQQFLSPLLCECYCKHLHNEGKQHLNILL